MKYYTKMFIYVKDYDVKAYLDNPEEVVLDRPENMIALMQWLGYEGLQQVKASELEARCRRRLWPLERNNDDESIDELVAAPDHNGQTYIVRPAGHLRKLTERVLHLIQTRAKPDSIMDWG